MGPGLPKKVSGHPPPKLLGRGLGTQIWAVCSCIWLRTSPPLDDAMSSKDGRTPVGGTILSELPGPDKTTCLQSHSGDLECVRLLGL